MRHKKVRVCIPHRLRESFGAAEVIAQIGMEGTVRDLLDHLEDAYPTLVPTLRGCRVEIGGLPAEDDAIVPSFTDVSLAPPATP